MTSVPPIANQAVTAAFDTFSPAHKARALSLRATIFEVAHEIEGVGEIEETLKWGQPSYLTVRPRSGTTIRIGELKPRNNALTGTLALFTHCQTSLVRDFEAQFPEAFEYEGNRAVCVASDAEADDTRLRFFIGNALTYHMAR